MLRCPECNSKEITKAGRQWSRNRATGRRIRTQQYRCKKCGRNTIYPRGSK